MNKLDFAFGSGIVRYCDWRITPELPLQAQLAALKEDLIQVEYGDSVMVDVGWYPQGDPTGEFVVYVIAERKWNDPVAAFRASTVERLSVAVAEAVQTADELVRHRA
ncbi:MAG: hypothetical protein KC776_22215 [Myxococcales bacterium]|nr:hypothetical protein [Myxococcales bacterium]MCB9575647.1 hypothetical protein [Polyangiaceae bacterium]